VLPAFVPNAIKELAGLLLRSLIKQNAALQSCLFGVKEPGKFGPTPKVRNSLELRVRLRQERRSDQP
jgi:hypothetical protein